MIDTGLVMNVNQVLPQLATGVAALVVEWVTVGAAERLRGDESGNPSVIVGKRNGMKFWLTGAPLGREAHGNSQWVDRVSIVRGEVGDDVRVGHAWEVGQSASW